MAHKITPVLKPKPGQASVINVSDEVKEELEGFWDFLVENGISDYEGYAEFDTTKEMNSWIRQARTYLNSREDEALKFRQLNSKGLPEGHLRFQITRDVPANGERKGNKTGAGKTK